jgi:hypothetical protein
VGDGPDHVRPGDEHVARLLDHQDEVRDGRRVDGAAGAGPQDRRDLRHHAGGQGVAQENVRVAAQRRHPLLDARPAGVVEADDRRPALDREVHDLADLARIGLRQRAAEDGEVLGEDVDQAAVDRAVAGHHAVAGHLLLLHPEVPAAVGDQRVELDEGAGVDQQLDPLAGRELAFPVLALDPFRAAAGARGFEARFEHCHVVLAHGISARGPRRSYRRRPGHPARPPALESARRR